MALAMPRAWLNGTTTDGLTGFTNITRPVDHSQPSLPITRNSAAQHIQRHGPLFPQAIQCEIDNGGEHVAGQPPVTL